MTNTKDVFQEKDWLVIKLPERQGHEQTKDIAQIVKRELTQGKLKFVLDAADLKFIDSFSAGFFISLLRHVREKDGDVCFRNLSGEPMELFKLAGLDKIFAKIEGTTVIKAEESLFSEKLRNGFDVKHEIINDMAVFHLSGDMYFEEGVKLFKECAILVLEKRNKILLDFEKFVSFDTGALNEILKINSILKESGGSMRFCNLNNDVRAWLLKLNIDKIIPLYQTTEEAMKEW